MSVKRTIASATTAATAHLWRVPLRCRWTATQVLRALGDEPLPFALVGRWAGGGAIVGADPVRVAGDADDPFATLDDLPVLNAAPPLPEGAVGGGWFGWLGYRLAARVEEIPLAPYRPVALPDFHLAYYDNVLRRDPTGRWWFEALSTDARRDALTARAEQLARRLRGDAPAPGRGDSPPPRPPTPLTLTAGDAAHHLDAVADCRRRIAAGEIFQANICLRLAGHADHTAAQLLEQALGTVAPPFAAAFDTPRGGIASLSPELFLRRRGRHIVTGPIKGTIARDRDPGIAAAALQRLRGSAKDAAEHVMIVDLMRNDLGRVCEYGSVLAPRHPTAEPHPGLWHLVSYVQGRLREGVGDGEVLRATFPPGSVTGAPKVQSLRVIAALERSGREVYTGAIGFTSPVAGLQLSVAIRTLELAGGRLWLGAGGGIVADSDPRRELEEALAKARPIAAAAGSSVVIHNAELAHAGHTA
ncbi:MAG TPA: anthranilate synthase component I family protein [Solirubrobacteraceae bacterium]